jgi:uncharacterized protein YigE (DUF2233 family)
LLFVRSKDKINFCDYVNLFKGQGCKNALYLDGFVSLVYDPKNGLEQMDGNFGVIIGTSSRL